MLLRRRGRIGYAGGGLGPELVSNGGMDSDTAWTKGTGWTISGGVATHAAGSAGDFYQNAGIQASRWYRVQVTTVISAGTLTIRLGSGLATGGVISTSGTHLLTLQSYSTVNGNALFQASATLAGSIDNVSIRAIL